MVLCPLSLQLHSSLPTHVLVFGTDSETATQKLMAAGRADNGRVRANIIAVARLRFLFLDRRDQLETKTRAKRESMSDYPDTY